jgi:ribonuclease inhibitor
MNTTTDYPVKERILNFSQCKYLNEVHQVIQQELELPDWYGKNLSALWDSLTGIMYTPAEITIIYDPNCKDKALADEIKKMIEIFKRAADEYGEIVLSVLTTEREN